jgi:hypothetical protein
MQAPLKEDLMKKVLMISMFTLSLCMISVAQGTGTNQPLDEIWEGSIERLARPIIEENALKRLQEINTGFTHVRQLLTTKGQAIALKAFKKLEASGTADSLHAHIERPDQTIPKLWQGILASNSQRNQLAHDLGLFKVLVYFRELRLIEVDADHVSYDELCQEVGKSLNIKVDKLLERYGEEIKDKTQPEFGLYITSNRLVVSQWKPVDNN